ncbi:LPS-assembly protein LptD [Alkalilimnicola sp. S0819]|uniref:LPS-assembly protein LptD n=1 Tax=Alkalilimnicola sp. S0819 TaxID=2613922 RepID=UPI001261A25D|nr:LPS assembly protein LptD [Alkalilimnicola sp. S0819]KAB7622918.1 LPS assembly protein LptD [Alkalilimnicola sp. S0819]MPQ17243.1 LPS assembly protein LptD [Alkalilimnicola sp. S0819]
MTSAAAPPPLRPVGSERPIACGLPMPAPRDEARERHREQQPAEVDADQADYDGETGTYVFTGDVHLRRWDQQLQAQRLTYVEPTGRAQAEGGFRYEDYAIAVSGSEGYFLLDQDQGEVAQAQYQFVGSHAHGDADHVEIQNADQARYRRVSYTHCPPGEEDWWLRASTLKTDQASGVGEAYNARLSFMGVPFLYLPYVNFPIDSRRKSGFLAPRFGYSEEDGADIEIPWYWNIAPNYDATLRPRYIEERGLLMGTEFRYLQPSFGGIADVSYLHQDKLHEDDRWALGWEHKHRLFGRVNVSSSVNRVSDFDYLDDFGNNLRVSSETQLESYLLADWRAGQWAFNAEFQTWQTITDQVADRHHPYRRLPRLRASYSNRPGEGLLRYSLDTEVTHFVHPFDELRDTGTRLDMTPRISLPIQRLAGFVEPAVSVRHTSYTLDRVEDPTAPDNPQRTVPVVSIDSGIFLERNFTLFGRNLLQTLEPRLFYLYVPKKDQSDLPNFDTGLAAFTLSQMFSENRFTGADRVGDANQVAMGLTSRFIDTAAGREYLRLGIGQIYYFDDREVTLSPGQTPSAEDRRKRSDIIAEARLQFHEDFIAQAEYQWDPYDDLSEAGGLRLVYRPDRDSIFGLYYRQRRNALGDRTIEQVDAGTAWPLFKGWRLLARWNYSILDQTTLEQALGLEYRDCCWALRVLAQREVNPDVLTGTLGADDERFDNSIWIQLELTGLSAFGDDIDDYLRDTIYGYPDTE